MLASNNCSVNAVTKKIEGFGARKTWELADRSVSTVLNNGIMKKSGMLGWPKWSHFIVQGRLQMEEDNAAILGLLHM